MAGRRMHHDAARQVGAHECPHETDDSRAGSFRL